MMMAPELQIEHWLNSDTTISLEELRGRVVLIEAFQMLCPGCVSHGLPQAGRVGDKALGAEIMTLIRDDGGLESSQPLEEQDTQGTRCGDNGCEIPHRNHATRRRE